MIPVFQTRFGGKGNCMQAAASSFLELPLASVPDFGNQKGDAFTRMRVFFERHGYQLLRQTPPPDRFYFVTGTSTQGHEHIVIYCNGVLVHDPNPHGGGLVRIDGVLWPRPMRAIAKDAAPIEGDEIVLRAIQPNEGIRAWYRSQLAEMARRMAEEALTLVEKHYRPASDRLALDDDPVIVLRGAMRAWGREWTRRFNKLSIAIANSFAGRTRRYTDAQIRKRMRDAGFTVRFQASPRMLSAYRAVIAENVGLIRSIPQQFHKDVESAVWTAVTKGGAMHELSTTIRKRYGITYRRAALIARDQVNKSKATLENARRAELGITEAIWQHSNAGKEPRPTHARMNGKRFKIADGMYDSAEGRNVQPGELINCRCTSRSVISRRLGKRAD
jgi:SPP1 gp7 family putative phage head morphogenesis protein